MLHPLSTGARAMLDAAVERLTDSWGTVPPRPGVQWGLLYPASS
jgi:hypothetical protein